MKNTAKQIGIILLASMVLAGVANLVHPRKIPWVQDWSGQVEKSALEQDIRIIPFATALEKYRADESLFVDARPLDEFVHGHIPDAVSLPFQALATHVVQLIQLVDSEKELVIYCSNRECDDALLLARELKVVGATNLYLFVDGFDGWFMHGGEVDR